MALKLMYITNQPEIAQIAEAADVDRIFVDLEYIGKEDRQGGKDTVMSKHTIDDVKAIAKVLSTAELLVRVNPIHEATEDYTSSQEEIDAVIAAGADILMLPYFKTVAEVQTFLNLVNGRAKTMLLLETTEAVEVLDDILMLPGIDSIHIGLNDLSLGYGMKFMFQLLANGTVETLCNKIRAKGIPYGFGGIASLDGGMVPGRIILKEHYRLGSTCAILSRSFCNVSKVPQIEEVRAIFTEGVQAIRQQEEECQAYLDYFAHNKANLDRAVTTVVKAM